MEQPNGPSHKSRGKRNNKAYASLILGALAVLLFAANFAPSLWSVVGAAGAIAGVLALWFGYQGILIDTRYRRGGKDLAYTGISLGAAGVIAFGVLFALGGHPELQLADIGVGTPRTTYTGDEFQLEYPETWQQQDLSQQPFCTQQSVECLIGLTLPFEDGSNLTFIRYELTREVSLEEVDDFFWRMYNDNISDVNLESKEDLTINGNPAIKRIYNSPSPQNASSREYLLQVGLVYDQWYYQFTGWTPGPEARSKHERDFMRVIRSLEFTQ